MHAVAAKTTGADGKAKEYKQDICTDCDLKALLDSFKPDIYKDIGNSTITITLSPVKKP